MTSQLENKINALPAAAQAELSDFVDYLCYKFGSAASDASEMQKFRREMAEAQAWAKEVGLTEQDITDAIKEYHRELQTQQTGREAIA